MWQELHMVSTSIYIQKILTIFNNHILSEENHLSTSSNQPVLTEDNKCQLRQSFTKKTQNINIQHFTHIYSIYKAPLLTEETANL